MRTNAIIIDRNQSNILAQKAAFESRMKLPALRANNSENEGSYAIQKVPSADQQQNALDRPLSVIRAWSGPISGPMLRRSARLADRVIVTLTSGTVSALTLNRLTTVLGRKDGIGLLLLGLDKTLTDSPDRVGPVKQFWNTTRETQ